jgi:hypothetical protein
MKKTTLAGLVVVTVASVTATAWAFQDVSDITIAKLEIQRTSGLPAAGYRLYSASSSTFTGSGNPANCPGTTFAEVHPSASAAERVAMNNMLMAALLAGKRVSVRIAGSTCSTGTSTGFPAYEAVRIQP